MYGAQRFFLMVLYHAGSKPLICAVHKPILHHLWSSALLSCRYTVRCNRADIAVSVSWYNDIEPWALHGLSHATCHSDWCQRAGYMPTLYNIRGFTQTDSAITLYTRKLWHRRYFLNREVPYWLQSSITGSAFRGLLLILQKNSMLTDTKIFRSRMGAFRCIVTRHPSRVRNRIRWRSF